MTIKAKKSKINLREKLAELLNFRQIRDRLDGLGLYIGKDRTGSAENVAVRGGANVDDLQLAEISAAVGGTAVDVFVYDTRNDSDGGKWRERTSHTSWYNEELNTATRGGRREFPAVAVIVAEESKVTIYDGDDPDLSMWMVFNTNLGAWHLGGYDSSANVTSITMLNGILVAGATHPTNSISRSLLSIVQFITDKNTGYRHQTYVGLLDFGAVVYRNSMSTYLVINDGSVPVNPITNDVAMTVLPNAPIDDDTGLPIPTIAVATDGGVSVIKDDGSVVDLNISNRPYSSVYFSDDYSVWAVENPGGVDYDLLRYFSIPTGDITTAPSYGPNSNPALFPSNTIGNFFDSFAYGSPVGLTKLDHNSSDVSKSLAAYTTSTYNTGWMPGDIKLATLSDTKIEKVGIDETTELVTNGGFDADDTSGWTLGGSPTITFSTSGVIDVTGDGEGLYQDIAPGTYLVSVGTISGTGGEVRFTDMDSSTQLFAASQSGDSLVITSVGNLRVYIRASGNNLASFDNISVKQTGELITNGTFDDGIEGWTDNSDSDPAVGSSVVGAELVLTGTVSAAARIYQELDTVIGETYTISYEVVSLTASVVNFKVGSTSVTSTEYFNHDVDSDGVGVYSRTFVATTVKAYPNLYVSNGSVTLDNISVRLAEDDRSVNDNGLQIFGEITKSPVAPGADLVAYSGFSAENYLMQPYNSDLDFGTGDFCIMGWVKSDGSIVGDNYLYVRGEYNGGWSGPVHYAYFQASSGGKLRWRISDDGDSTRDELESSSAISSSWTHICLVRQSSNLYMYINGSLDITGSISNASSSLDNTSASFILGVHPSLSTSLALDDVSVSLFRISATVPTPEQIAKIYRDEKVLFQDGAQATLYGTSDAVTALAYDDKTELLHVGTSSGRSDFAGLRRINNTTIPVTTSISASNNLIAEQ
jgi:hypothetical protein